jgi:hypothetical protein
VTTEPDKSNKTCRENTQQKHNLTLTTTCQNSSDLLLGGQLRHPQPQCLNSTSSSVVGVGGGFVQGLQLCQCNVVTEYE